MLASRLRLLGGCHAVRWQSSGGGMMAMIKQLRAQTNAPVLDCKKALAADGVDGDLSKAVDWLRSKGVSSAMKRSGRAASEGLVGVATNGGLGAIVEVNCETDFVSRGDVFQKLVADVAEQRLSHEGDHETFAGEVNEMLLDVSAVVQENILLGRSQVVGAPTASDASGHVLSSYVHGSMTPGSSVGRSAVLVQMSFPADGSAPGDDVQASEVQPVGRQIAMHVLAANPVAVAKEDIPGHMVERERQVLLEQGLASGKPRGIVDKMMDGRMRKFYQEVALLEQDFIVGDGKESIQDVLKGLSDQVGVETTVGSFARFQVGEVTEA